jgi:hypothetical protein
MSERLKVDYIVGLNKVGSKRNLEDSMKVVNGPFNHEKLVKLEKEVKNNL